MTVDGLIIDHMGWYIVSVNTFTVEIIVFPPLNSVFVHSQTKNEVEKSPEDSDYLKESEYRERTNSGLINPGLESTHNTHV